MKMRVQEKILPPGMKYRQKTDIGAQVLGIRCNPTECLRSGPEKNIVYDSLILPCNGTDAVRNGKNNVEIPDR